MTKQSGLPFQYEIEERIAALGFETLPEQSYIDDVELKPRDIDIVAIRKVPSYKSRDTQLALVAEAKHISGETIALLRDNPKNKKAYHIDGFWSQDLEDQMDSFFHISSRTVAMSLSNKDLFGAVMQSIKALLYLRTKPLLSQAGMFYPMVVYKGGTIVDQNGVPLKNFSFYKNYEWRNPESGKIDSRSLYIDIVHESSLEHIVKENYSKEFNTLSAAVGFQNRIIEARIEQNRNERRNSAR